MKSKKLMFSLAGIVGASSVIIPVTALTSCSIRKIKAVITHDNLSQDVKCTPIELNKQIVVTLTCIEDSIPNPESFIKVGDKVYKLNQLEVKIVGSETGKIKYQFILPGNKVTSTKVEVNVKCTSKDKKVLASSISWVNLPPEKILLSNTKTLEYKIYPTNTTITNLSWSSSNPKVLSVDHLGNISANAEGSATITAKSVDGSNKIIEKTFTVVNNSAVSIKGERNIDPEKTPTVQFSIEEQNKAVSNLVVNWSVEPYKYKDAITETTDIGTIDSTGKLTISEAVKARGGSAKIKATSPTSQFDPVELIVEFASFSKLQKVSDEGGKGLDQGHVAIDSSVVLTTGGKIIMPSCYYNKKGERIATEYIEASAFANSQVTSLFVSWSIAGTYKNTFACMQKVTDIKVSEYNVDYTSKVGSTECNCVMTKTDDCANLIGGCNNTNFSVIKDKIQFISTTAFYGNLSKEELDLSNFTKLKSIGESAFQYHHTALKTIKLPAGLESIGPSAFESCKALETINMPSSLKEIGSTAFYLCEKLTSVDLSTCSNLKEIKSYTFGGCTSLKTFKPSDSIESFGGGAFNNCSAMDVFAMPASLRFVCNDTFNGCSDAFFTQDSENNITYVKSTGNDHYICYKSASTSANPTIHANTVLIANNAFEKNNYLMNLTIPTKVIQIGYDAFASCPNLVKINFPARTGTEKLDIADRAFQKNKSLVGVTIPKYLNSLGRDVFAYCEKSFQTLSFENDGILKEIPASAFENDFIQSLDLSNTVIEKIGKQAFAKNWSIASIELKNSHLIEIGDEAFEGAMGLVKEITIPATVTTLGNGVFSLGTKAYFTSALETVTFESEETAITGGVLAPRLFQNNANLKTIVNFPTNITEIGDYSFQGCSSFDQTDILANAQIIGQSAFENAGMSTVTISDKTKTIKEKAFVGCPVTNITVDAANTNFTSRDSEDEETNCLMAINASGNKLVLGSSNSVIPNTVTRIEENAFRGNKAILNMTEEKVLTIPTSVIKIGKNAFTGTRPNVSGKTKFSIHFDTDAAVNPKFTIESSPVQVFDTTKHDDQTNFLYLADIHSPYVWTRQE